MSLYGQNYTPLYSDIYHGAYELAGTGLPAFHAIDDVAGVFHPGVIIGVGDITEARTGSIYLPDDFGVWQEYATTVPGEVYAGGKWWLYGGPARTNEITQSYNIAHAAWTQSGVDVAALDAVGMRGEANGASTLTDNTSGALELMHETVPVPNDSNTNVFRWWIEKDTTETRFPDIECILLGGTVQKVSLSLNTKTGASSKARVDVGTNSIEVNQVGDWWECLASVLNNSTGNVSGQIVLAPAFGTSLGGAVDNAAIGSIIVGNVELHLDTTIESVRGTPPIFTSGAPASINATDLSFDDANHSDLQGGYYCEFRNVGVDASAGLLGLGGTGRFFYPFAAANFKAFDGTTSITGPAVTLAADDVEYKIGLAYGDDLQRINTDGAWGAAGAYDGVYDNLLNKIAVFSEVSFSGPVERPMLVRNIRRYNLNYIAAQAQIDALMA